MKTSDFDELTKKIWSPLLEGGLGFEFESGAFCRELDGGIRQILLLDFDVSQGKTFRIIAGFNASVIAGELPPVEAGVFGARYLDDKGLSAKPRNFPCYSRDAAEKSLSESLQVIEKVVVPWFANYETVDALVGIIEEQYPFIKGKLLFHAGQPEQAKDYLLRHLEYLTRQQQIPAVVNGMNETREMLKHCM